ncbi:hypothetical protein [Holospora curviuscula]|uniref:hypothetical protein n=1 Tax=Holospora curviuscula TaxID=1082868 RepID=UPI001A9C96BF|nr:hypothetical protein [Holospora curviuscula]
MGCAIKNPKEDPEKRSVFFQKRDQLKSKVNARGFSHGMPRTHGYSLKGKRYYRK